MLFKNKQNENRLKNEERMGLNKSVNKSILQKYYAKKSNSGIPAILHTYCTPFIKTQV